MLESEIFNDIFRKLTFKYLDVMDISSIIQINFKHVLWLLPLAQWWVLLLSFFSLLKDSFWWLWLLLLILLMNPFFLWINLTFNVSLSFLLLLLIFLILLRSIFILSSRNILLLSCFILDRLWISDWLINSSLDWSFNCLNRYFSSVYRLLYNSYSSWSQNFSFIINWSLWNWVLESVGRL